MIQAVEDMGKLDNTLIIYISGDNGASAEGSPNGTPSEVMQFNGVELPVAEQMKFYDAWGTQYTYNHLAVPWAWAFDTPYKWTKQIPSFFGGTRKAWRSPGPASIKDKGGVRWQFHHVIDIVPTLLEVTGIPAPDTVDGIAQKPIEGVSMAYTFDKANADAPSPHHTQYFEMMGVQGLYNDGWMLSAVPKRAAVGSAWARRSRIPPARTSSSSTTYAHDWTQYTDVAAAQSRQGEGDDRPDVRRVRQISGAAARRFGGDAPRGAAPEPDRRPQGVHLFRRADHRHSVVGRAEPAQHLLHDHRRYRRAAGRRRRHDRDRRAGASAATACIC